MYGDVSDRVTTNGLVEPTKELQARANFAGMVDKVLVELGDTVRPGQMLVSMKDPFANARVATAKSVLSSAQEATQDIHHGGTQEERVALASDLEHAQQAEASAQHSLGLVTQLFRDGSASAGEVEAAQKHQHDDQITLTALQQRSSSRYTRGAVTASDVRLADAQASLGAANTTFANANTSSSMGGTVYSVSVSPYDFVPMGADLLRVADLDQMQVRVFFYEPEVGKLKAGQPVTITWDARPNLVWHGHIRQAPVSAKPMGDRSVAECLIQLDDSRRDLLPNTHVVVTVPVEEHTHVLTIPRQALQTDRLQDFVFRILEGKLVRTPVHVGLVSLDAVEIVAGLTAKDLIAVHTMSNAGLSDHLAVTPAP